MNYSADCFVVPNEIYVFGTAKFADEQMAKRLEPFGHVPQNGEPLVQIWTISPERPKDNLHCWSENWSGHGMPKEVVNQFQWPSYIPLSLLPKEEGKNVQLKAVNGDTYELTARQLKYRYASFGTFQEVLEKLLNAVVKS